MKLKDIYLFEQLLEKELFLHDEEDDKIELELTKNDNKDLSIPSGIMGASKEDDDEEKDKSYERSHDWSNEDDSESEEDGGEEGGEAVGESIDSMLESCIAKECDMMKNSTITISKENKIEEQAAVMPASPGHTPGDTMMAAKRGQIMARCLSKYPTDPVKRRMCVASGGMR